MTQPGARARNADPAARHRRGHQRRRLRHRLLVAVVPVDAADLQPEGRPLVRHHMMNASQGRRDRARHRQPRQRTGQDGDRRGHRDRRPSWRSCAPGLPLRPGRTASRADVGRRGAAAVALRARLALAIDHSLPTTAMAPTTRRVTTTVHEATARQAFTRAPRLATVFSRELPQPVGILRDRQCCAQCRRGARSRAGHESDRRAHRGLDQRRACKPVTAGHERTRAPGSTAATEPAQRRHQRQHRVGFQRRIDSSQPRGSLDRRSPVVHVGCQQSSGSAAASRQPIGLPRSTVNAAGRARCTT